MYNKLQRFTAYLIILSLLCLPTGGGFANYELSLQLSDEGLLNYRVATTTISTNKRTWDFTESNAKGKKLRSSPEAQAIKCKDELIGFLTIAKNGELKFKAKDSVDVTVKFMTGSITVTELIAAKVENYANQLNLRGKFSFKNGFKTAQGTSTYLEPNSELVCGNVAEFLGKLYGFGSLLTVEQEQPNKRNFFADIESDQFTAKVGPNVIPSILFGKITTKGQLAWMQTGLTTNGGKLTRKGKSLLGTSAYNHVFSSLKLNDRIITDRESQEARNFVAKALLKKKQTEKKTDSGSIVKRTRSNSGSDALPKRRQTQPAFPNRKSPTQEGGSAEAANHLYKNVFKTLRRATAARIVTNKNTGRSDSKATNKNAVKRAKEAKEQARIEERKRLAARIGGTKAFSDMKKEDARRQEVMHGREGKSLAKEKNKLEKKLKEKIKLGIQRNRVNLVKSYKDKSPEILAEVVELIVEDLIASNVHVSDAAAKKIEFDENPKDKSLPIWAQKLIGDLKKIFDSSLSARPRSRANSFGMFKVPRDIKNSILGKQKIVLNTQDSPELAKLLDNYKLRQDMTLKGEFETALKNFCQVLQGKESGVVARKLIIDLITENMKDALNSGSFKDFNLTHWRLAINGGQVGEKKIPGIIKAFKIKTQDYKDNSEGFVKKGLECLKGQYDKTQEVNVKEILLLLAKVFQVVELKNIDNNNIQTLFILNKDGGQKLSSISKEGIKSIFVLRKGQKLTIQRLNQFKSSCVTLLNLHQFYQQKKSKLKAEQEDSSGGTSVSGGLKFATYKIITPGAAQNEYTTLTMLDDPGRPQRGTTSSIKVAIKTAVESNGSDHSQGVLGLIEHIGSQAQTLEDPKKKIGMRPKLKEYLKKSQMQILPFEPQTYFEHMVEASKHECAGFKVASLPYLVSESNKEPDGYLFRVKDLKLVISTQFSGNPVLKGLLNFLNAKKSWKTISLKKTSNDCNLLKNFIDDRCCHAFFRLNSNQVQFLIDKLSSNEKLDQKFSKVVKYGMLLSSDQLSNLKSQLQSMLSANDKVYVRIPAYEYPLISELYREIKRETDIWTPHFPIIKQSIFITALELQMYVVDTSRGRSRECWINTYNASGAVGYLELMKLYQLSLKVPVFYHAPPTGALFGVHQNPNSQGNYLAASITMRIAANTDRRSATHDDNKKNLNLFVQELHKKKT